MTFDYTDQWIRDCIRKGKTGEIGLERETLRVNESGRMAQTPHPFSGSDAITRDFCENQVEIITPPSKSAEQAVKLLYGVHREAAEKLLSLDSGAEYLWPFSNPPCISGEEEIPIARFHGISSSKTTYREYLARKYGKRKMLFCGIHLNFSFSDKLLESAFSRAGVLSAREFKDSVYLSLAQKTAAYGWLITYLTAASPVIDSSFFTKPTNGSRYASVRCGALGYWNDFVPVFDYGSIDSYTESIWRYIRDGRIASPSELYYPIRLKPKGENRLDHLRENGVNHIELRMIDVNPLTPAGIFEEDIFFIQLFLLYLMSLQDEAFGNDAQLRAAHHFKQAALYDDRDVTVTVCGEEKPIRQEALRIVRDMKVFFAGIAHDTQITAVLDYQENKLTDRSRSYAFRIREMFGDDFTSKGLSLAKRYAQPQQGGVI